MRYAGIYEHCWAYGLAESCAVLEVSISGYQAWKRGGSPNCKRLTDAQMPALIQAIHKKLRNADKAPRMARELRSREFPASRERFWQLMRENGVRARHKGPFKATTDSKHTLPGGAEPAGQELRTCEAESSLKRRHDLHLVDRVAGDGRHSA